MVESPDWTESSLSEYYSDGSGIDLSWLDKPTRHQFRWRTMKGPWVTSRKRISSGQSLVKAFDSMPTDVYVSTSSWLDPVNLPRLKDSKRPPPILIDHMVVFDIDMRPFCRSRLELARKETLILSEWVTENTDLEIRHVSFSGSKGFHIVASDPDRSLFEEPDPAKREQAVRENRKDLLERVIEAGHDVDPVVTADTRRIIRVPGTLHGSNGWACSVIEEGWLERPVREWIADIPKHEMATRMPRRPPIKIPRFKPRKKPVVGTSTIMENSDEFISLEVSSHVPGTKDRSALVAWLPDRWGNVTESVDRAQREFDSIDLGPVAYMHDGERVLAIIPRAIPRDFLLSRIGRMGMRGLENDLRRFEHSWVRISGRMVEGGWESEMKPISVLGYDSSQRCMHPWSASHLDLCKRLDLPIRHGAGDISGDPKASIRVAVRR
jgi:hypothetical protein